MCNPRKNRNDSGNKSDRIDARQLARWLRSGDLSPVYHGQDSTRVLKELVRGYENLVADSARTKNRLKAIYRSQGESTSGGDVYKLEQREEWLSRHTMRKRKVEGEYQIDFWPKGPESSLCPLARPDIAMGHESQIEAWSACGPRRIKTSGSHPQIASCVRRNTTVSKSETTCHRLLGDHPAERRRGLGCQGQRHRGGRKYALDIPLHRRNLWTVFQGWDGGIPNSKSCVSGWLRCGLLCRNGCPHLSQVRAWYTLRP